MLWLNNGFIIVGNCEIALEIVLLWMERKSKRSRKTFKNNYDLQHTSFIWNGWCLRVFGIDCTLKSNCCTLAEVVTRIYDHNIVVATVRHGQPRYRNRSVCRFKTNVFGKFYHIRVYRLAQALHAPPGVHLPIRRGTFKVSNGRQNIYFHIIYFQIFIHTSVNIIFKSHYSPIVEYIYE